MSHESWATSARFHHAFGDVKEHSIETVLEDYGLPPTGFGEDRTHFDVSEEIRRCKTCEMVKPLVDFAFQTKRVRGEEKRYHDWECRACKKAKTKKSPAASGKQLQKDLADAPILAAVRLMDDHPEALALLIKHFKQDFVLHYQHERELAVARDEARRSIV